MILATDAVITFQIDEDILEKIPELGAVGEASTYPDKCTAAGPALVALRTPVNNIEYFPPNFEGLVLGCIDADFCK